MLTTAHHPVLRIDALGNYVSFGSVTIDLRTRRPLKRIIVALADHRAQAPGEGLSSSDLFAAGWPGERADARSAAARVHTAMYSLRRMGLRDVLLRRNGGYSIDLAIDVEHPAQFTANIVTLAPPAPVEAPAGILLTA